jgi:hypothetical protein
MGVKSGQQRSITDYALALAWNRFELRAVIFNGGVQGACKADVIEMRKSF